MVYYLVDQFISWFSAYILAEESALRLAITLFSGYPLSLVYRSFLHKKDPVIQHCFFTIVGIGLLAFNYGIGCYHSMIGVLVAYALCNFIGGTVISVVIAWVFYMTYLIVGYWVSATDQYDIKWTMPQCILTLRMIGLVIDVYDGAQLKEGGPKVDTAIPENERPSLLEIAGFSYFYGGFLVGPQFHIGRYRDFVAGKFCDPETGGPPKSITWCLIRLAPGLAYMVVHQIMAQYYQTSYFLTDDFVNESAGSKWLTCVIWFRVMTFKYQSVWCITESVCILSGIAYNGVDEKGVVQWNGVRNIRLTKFELGYTFQYVVESFNFNTNQWVFKYVFKRLRFLGNKNASHVLTLMFLAIWHGNFSGYFGCFMYEFVCVISERQFVSLLKRVPKITAVLQTQPLFFLCCLVCKVITVSCCAFGFLPFALLTFERWTLVYNRIYWVGWVAFVVWQLLNVVLRRVLPRGPKEEKHLE